MRKTIKTILILLIISILASPGTADAQVRIAKKAEHRSAELSVDFVQENEKIIVKLFVTPKNQSINAVGINFTYSESVLDLLDLDLSNSFCELFAEKEVKIHDGEIRLGCGLPYPGITKKSEIATLEFRNFKSGWTNLSFKNDSVVLANDGYGTDILKSIKNKSIYFD